MIDGQQFLIQKALFYSKTFKEWDLEFQEAKTFKDFNEILRSLEKHQLFISSQPIFSYTYPSNYSNLEFINSNNADILIERYGISKSDFGVLINNGFIVANKSHFDKLLKVNPYDRVVKQEYFLIDERYGIICEKKDQGYTSFALSVDEYDDYFKTYDFLKNPSDVLDIGSILAHKILNLPINREIITLHVKSRDELERIIKFWECQISNTNFSLWFRGQTSEYYCKDFSELNNKSICPWRNVVDIALTPSIFRVKDIKTYTGKLLDSFKYKLLLKDYFRECLITRRSSITEQCKEKIPEHLMMGEWSTSISIDGKPYEVHDYHMQYVELVENLFKQHYGLESPLLDITSDIDIALFFAQNKLIENKYAKINVKETNPVLYGFILNNELDPVINSSILMQDLKALRPVRQNCGVIMGAYNLCKEFYSRFISFKIVIDDEICYNPNYTPEYLFPSEDEDDFLKLIKEIKKVVGIKYLTPFELQKDI